VSIRIYASTHCPTWATKPLRGWRWIMALVLPRRWFQYELERNVFMFNNSIILSPENYALIHEAMTSKAETFSYQLMNDWYGRGGVD
jgi:hypothetical protein